MQHNNGNQPIGPNLGVDPKHAIDMTMLTVHDHVFMQTLPTVIEALVYGPEYRSEPLDFEAAMSDAVRYALRVATQYCAERPTI